MDEGVKTTDDVVEENPNGDDRADGDDVIEAVTTGGDEDMVANVFIIVSVATDADCCCWK